MSISTTFPVTKPLISIPDKRYEEECNFVREIHRVDSAKMDPSAKMGP